MGPLDQDTRLIAILLLTLSHPELPSAAGLPMRRAQEEHMFGFRK